MRYVVTVNGRQHTIELEANGHVRQVTFDGRALAVDWQLVGRNQPAVTLASDASADHYSLLSGDHSYAAYARAVDDFDADEQVGRTIEVMIEGQPYMVNVQDARSQALASLAGGTHAAGEATIRAPMPGLVSQVLVAEGDEVQRGQTIAILEAMKMENDLTTPRAGRVRAVRVAKGQTVAQNAVLAIIGDPEDAPAPDESEE